MNRIWPAHIQRWGEVREVRSLGAFFDAESGRIRVWLRLDQELAERSLEIAFVGDKLNIFDLNAATWPVEARAAPLDGDRLGGFDFDPVPPFTTTLKRKGRSQRLELQSRDGSTRVFEPAR